MSSRRSLAYLSLSRHHISITLISLSCPSSLSLSYLVPICVVSIPQILSIMCDDLANYWGASLVIPDRCRSQNKRKAIDSFLHSDSNSETALRELIKESTNGQFSLEKLTPNGSDANLFAITSLSNGDSNGVLIACGSYVAGDLGPLQHWSTADFHVDDGPSFIVDPGSTNVSDGAKMRSVALPYWIPGTCTQRQQDSFEDLCLHGLHKRCLFQKTVKRPVTTLFLELLLASNGSVLSDRCLSRIGMLAAHHNFSIIVDEILTGGRISSMLMTMSKPLFFVEQVAYITMGKWFGCGLVLSSKKQDIIVSEKQHNLVVRGTTTSLRCDDVLPYFEKMLSMLPSIVSRRNKVLSRFPSLSNDSIWGEGLIVFMPRRCLGVRVGLKNRLLPLLSDTPIDNIITSAEPTWNKVAVSKKTMSCIIKWTVCPFFIDRNFYIEHHLLCLFEMIVYIVDHTRGDDDPWMTTSQIHEFVTKKSLEHETATTRTSTSILRLMERAGLLHKQLKTTKRLQGWSVVKEAISYPWDLEGYNITG